ncbi:MAG: DUF2062 domain-containing protein [Gammaproteobacteria bacterium]|nr:DUF2062 domain-containing protein [Gammaproteobacteria bacterium]
MKKTIKRMMPDHRKIRNHKHLQILGSLLHQQNLWHFNRRSASGAFAVGLFMAWVPVPFQMLLGAAGAILFKVNLPLSVALVWISNPITMPPLFYFAYLLGAKILGTPANEFNFELSTEWLLHGMDLIWQPFLLGCLIMGIISSALGYVSVRLLWRLHLVQHLKERKLRKKNRRDQQKLDS